MKSWWSLCTVCFVWSSGCESGPTAERVDAAGDAASDVDAGTHADASTPDMHDAGSAVDPGADAGAVAVDLIPTARRVDWSMVGVPGGIPRDRTHVIDVTAPPYGADATGARDAHPAIQGAIDASRPGDVIYLPAGTYRLESTLLVGYFGGRPAKSNVTIRGAGMDATTLDCRAMRCIEVGSESDYLWDRPRTGNAITAGLEKGSTRITIGDASEFVVGDLVRVRVDDDPSLPVVSVFGFTGLRRQLGRVTAKTATTLDVTPAIYGDFSHLRATVGRARFASVGVGIEDLGIDGSSGSVTFGVVFQETASSWLSNVRVRHSANFSVFVKDSLHFEMRGCYLDELMHTGSNGAGLLFEGSSASLVEDNIIVRSFPHIEINYGASGNVFAYNFLEGNDAGGLMGASIDSNHAPHNAFNLFEGNVASVFESDGYFGSDSDETLFRNWFHATCDTTNQFGRAVQLNRFSRNFNVIGNVLGRSGYVFRYDNDGGSTSYANRYAFMFGLPNIGNGGFNGMFAQLSAGRPWADWGMPAGANGFQELDLDVRPTTLLLGNWNAADSAVRADEALAAGTRLPASLYLASKPAFFGTLAWPPFDPAAPNQSYEAIPAGGRYVRGSGR